MVWPVTNESRSEPEPAVHAGCRARPLADNDDVRTGQGLAHHRVEGDPRHDGPLPARRHDADRRLAGALLGGAAALAEVGDVGGQLVVGSERGEPAAGRRLAGRGRGEGRTSENDER